MPTRIIYQNINNGSQICCKDPAALNYSHGVCQNVCLDNSCCLYSNNQTNVVTGNTSTIDFDSDLVVSIFNTAARVPSPSLTNNFNCQVLKDDILDELTVFNITSVWNVSPNYLLNQNGNINEFLGIESYPRDCCNSFTLGPTPNNQSFYYWAPIDSQQFTKNTCYLRECPSDVVCVTCDTVDTTLFANFDWWNDLYIQNHNGQSLQTSFPLLWQKLTDIVVNSGLTFYVDATNGDLLDEACCFRKNGSFIDGICICTPPVGETQTPRCLSTIEDILDLISDPDGYVFFVNNFQTIGTSLGLTQTQINFIKSEDVNGTPRLLSNLDTNNNSILDKTEARLLLTNALTTTGGFHLYFGDITNIPSLIPQTSCVRTNPTLTGRLLKPDVTGFWDGNNCMCKPISNQCTIDLSQVKTYVTKDSYNQNIEIVVYVNPDSQGNVVPISEACCNRLVKDNPNLTYVWQDQPTPYCYVRPKEDCLPVIFSLNENQMTVEPCSNDLEISMWVYFGKPEKPCGFLPEPPEEVIIIEGTVCDITLTPNTGAIVPSPNPPNTSTPPTTTPNNNVTTKCCYNNQNPILARVKLNNNLNNQLVQTQIYNSSINFFDTWFQLKANLPMSGSTLTFGVQLEIYQGLACCCDYDIFIDDIKVNCNSLVEQTVVNDIKCPGFTINKVIDNKKSWVYNPGTESVGISDYDNGERSDGSFGTLNGEGSINRTFAPSLDAEIPWRYTDYLNQSSVRENHSNLVINSKELWLTYDMCAKCPISGITLTCPEGYILSANTQICYSGNT